MADRVWVFDTTLRDGSQTMGVNFSVEDKIRLAHALDEFGVDYIEGGWPGSNPKDVTFFERMKSETLSHARLTAFSSTRMKRNRCEDDPIVQQLVASDVPVATIFGKSWDLHVEKALKATLAQNLDMIQSTVEYLTHHFDEVIFDAEHFFDGYRANPEYALRCLQVAAEAGADWVVLCDTNGGSLVEGVQAATEAAVAAVSVPVGMHAHNDAGLGVANTLASVRAGARMVHGTINGLGERCGNADLCSVLPDLTLKMGMSTVPDGNLRHLHFLSHMVAETANQIHADSLPFVGRNAFAHKGGIHVSAVMRDTRTYEHVSPENVGNSRTISISDQSGKSNVLEKARELGLDLGDDAETARRILNAVKEMEAKGYHYEGAEASFELLAAREMGTLKDYFTFHGYRVHIWRHPDGTSTSEATVKVAVPEEVSRAGGYETRVEHTCAEGTGPVEALDNALRKVLVKFYPNLRDARLTDYKVRILDETQGTNASTRVLIETTDETREWGTVGVSDNIIDASWQALTDSLIFKLKRDEDAAAEAASAE